MNSPNIRLFAAASAAILSFILAVPFPVSASLSDHPEPSKLIRLRFRGNRRSSEPRFRPPRQRLEKSAPTSKPALPAPSPTAPDAAQGRFAATREEILSLARKGLLDSAFAVCKRALAGDPENAYLLLMMGKLSPDGKESSEYFKKAIKAGGASAEAEESLFRLGQFYYAAGNTTWPSPLSGIT